MQTGRPLSQLRQELLERYQPPREDLASFLSDYPLTKGTVYTLRRKCGKPTCRCAGGERHETVVLTANVGGKTQLWTIAKDRLDEIRERTEAYRKFRKSRAALVKKWAQRQAEMLRLIDAIEKARTRRP